MRCIMLAMTTIALLMNTNDSMAENSRILSFADVVQKVKQENVSVEMARLNVKAQEGSSRQEGLWVNPEISAEFDNFEGDGDYADRQSMEKTWMISQQMDVLGKRSLRKQKAYVDVQIAKERMSHQEREALSKASSYYAQVLASQLKVQLARKRMAVMGKMVQVVEKRTSVGKSSKLEKMRIETLQAEYKIKTLEKEQMLRKHMRQLEQLWNHAHIHFDLVLGDLKHLPELISAHILESFLDQNFLYKTMVLQEQQQKLLWTLANREWLPDVSIGGGVRHFNATDEKAYVANVSFSLPLFNRNQGRRKHEHARYETSQLLTQSMKTQIDVEFHDRYEFLMNLKQSIDIYQKELIPLSMQSLEVAQKGYEQGRLSYLEVLDVLKHNYDVQEKLWDVSVDYIQKYNQLQVLLARDPYVFENEGV